MADAKKKIRFTKHVGLAIEEATPGRSRASITIEDKHRNGTGVAHGGVLFTLADTAMGAALYNSLEPGEICATIEIKIGYFKPVFDGPLVCEAVVLNKGKSIASLEATIHNGEQLVSKATGTFSIFRRKTDAQWTEPAVSD
ncbi:PaaI family thioesterase [Ramlibacter sp. PS4R-6]|uniref:PaaI family thioesterase n=1 Tax=Ramlibacter sp. PS4R-6 TaxID=3133438 RepID=UPI0030A49711